MLIKLGMQLHIPLREIRKGLNVKLVVSHGGLSVGADGGSHQQIEDIAIMRAIPNMRVLVPSDSVMCFKTYLDNFSTIWTILYENG